MSRVVIDLDAIERLVRGEDGLRFPPPPETLLELVAEVRRLRAELERLGKPRCSSSWIDEALNSGDGTYRP